MNIQSGMYGVKQKEKLIFKFLKNLGLDEKLKLTQEVCQEV